MRWQEHWSDLTPILVSGENSPRLFSPCRRREREDLMKTLVATVANQAKYLIAAGMILANGLQPTGNGGAAFGQEPGPDRRDTNEALANAKNSTEAKSGYESLFKGSDSKRIRALKSHPDVGIGLMAAWEEVSRSVPWWRRESKPLDPKILEGFLEFAQSRLNAKIPDWWKTSIRGAQASSRTNFGFAVNSTMVENKALGLWIQGEVTLEKKSGDFVVKMKGEAATMKGEAIEKGKAGGYMATAFIDRDRVFLAFYDDSPGPFQLLCFDRKAGDLLWETQVWVFGAAILHMGPGHSNSVSISTTQNRVLVCGASLGWENGDTLRKAKASNRLRQKSPVAGLTENPEPPRSAGINPTP